MSYVQYESNNSGGRWWLNDEQWFALEQAGWVVEWETLGHKYTERGDYADRDENGIPVLVPKEESNGLGLFKDKDGRFLGALAQRAYRPGLRLREAAEEWERITGESSTDAGCACCGQPHRFTEYDTEGNYIASGPETHYEATWD